MSSDDRFLADTTALLARMPRVVHAILDDLPDGWLGATDMADGGWTARDVIGHLVTAELDDWIPRAERILEHGTAVPFDSFDRFAHEERDRGVPLSELLDRFAELRAANLERLAELVGTGDLDRLGSHPALGPVSLRNLLSTWAVHDLNHINQLFAALSGSHDAAVGPWKQYLGILLRRDDPGAMPG